MRSFGVDSVIQDHSDYDTLKEPMNPLSHSSVPLMYHDLSDPDPDHPKGTHPKNEK